MILIAGLVLGLAVAVLSGGRIASIASLRLRGESFALVGFVVQPLVHSIMRMLPSPLYGLALWLGSFVVIGVVCAMNGRAIGMRVVGVGVLLNALAVGLNAGMAVSADALVAAGARLAVLRADDVLHHVIELSVSLAASRRRTSRACRTLRRGGRALGTLCWS